MNKIENPTTKDIQTLLGGQKYTHFLKSLNTNSYRRTKYIVEDIEKLVNQGFLPDRLLDATMGIQYSMETSRLNAPVYGWLNHRSIGEIANLVLEIAQNCKTVGSVPFFLNALQIQIEDKNSQIVYKRVK